MKQNTNEREGELSEFNEGALQMRRIDKIQDRINSLNSNLLAYNDEIGKMNFEVVVASLKSLFKECSSKLSKEELDKGKESILSIKNYLLEKPLFTKMYTTTRLTARGLKNYDKKDIIPENWSELENLIDDFEIQVRRFLESHNLTSPKSKDPRTSISDMS